MAGGRIGGGPYRLHHQPQVGSERRPPIARAKAVTIPQRAH
jgi:hypothetical protein